MGDTHQSSKQKSGGGSGKNKDKQQKRVVSKKVEESTDILKSKCQVLSIIPIAFNPPEKLNIEGSLFQEGLEKEEHWRGSGTKDLVKLGGVLLELDQDKSQSPQGDIVAHTSKVTSLLSTALWSCLTYPDSARVYKADLHEDFKQKEISSDSETLFKGKDIVKRVVDSNVLENVPLAYNFPHEYKGSSNVEEGKISFEGDKVMCYQGDKSEDKWSGILKDKKDIVVHTEEGPALLSAAFLALFEHSFKG